IFPQKGNLYDYHFIKKISAENSEFQFPVQYQKIIKENTASYLADILSDNTARYQQFNDDSPLKTSQWSAAKTGTTKNYRDNWTIGFNSEFTVGVWSGNSDGSYLRQSTGVSGAAPIWHDIMEKLFLVRPGESIKAFTQAPIKPTNQAEKTNSEIVISPQNNDVFQLENNGQEAIIFKAKTEIDWYLDQKYLGQGKLLFWDQPTRGKHCFQGFEKQKLIKQGCFKVI
ncbi:MAG TPA: hypothetical protein PLQ36_04425, partial [Candidatus Gracilibacteria bacterium]|nr:hypothetical protein [Candidatus Gracilibacteria bacterium]